MTLDEVSTSLQFFQLVTRYYTPQVIYAAARLGIADLLAGGPQSVAELARTTETHMPTLGLLLRALTSIELLAEEPDGYFSLAPLGQYLRSDALHSQNGWALSHGETGYRVWAELLHTVRTGQPAFERVFGAGYYDYMAQNPTPATDWDSAMDQTARDWLGTLSASYDFTQFQTIVDVGGGRGTLIARILQAAPAARGVLLDLPHVVVGAAPILQAAGVADRCQVVGGDMLAAVPAGGDAYLLVRVLFNWDDQRSATILRSCRRAMAGVARLIVVDIVEPDSGRPPSAAFGDLNLLLTFGGHIRSESEFRALFAATDFAVTNILPTQSQFGIVEGRPV
jgi:hypothetical protein